jgi:hypothetical protein
MVRFREIWPDEPDEPDDPDDPDGVEPVDDGDALDDGVDADPSLEEAFPLGDGVADDGAVVFCPYCGEPNEIALDPGSGTRQAYVEDCQVCCQPWQVIVHYLPDGSADVTVLAADET